MGMSSNIYTAHLAHGGPPVLPMYKSNVRKRVPQQTFATTILIMFFLCGFLGFFFCSIYYGASFLHDHLQDEKWGNTIGLPGTRNIIQKWSVKHLGGIDLTQLGPPAKKSPPVDATKITPPFKFMFKLPFESHALGKKIENAGSGASEEVKLEKDGSDVLPALANSFEKLVAESVVTNEDKVLHLAEDFQKMVEEAAITEGHSVAEENSEALVIPEASEDVSDAISNEVINNETINNEILNHEIAPNLSVEESAPIVVATAWTVEKL